MGKVKKRLVLFSLFALLPWQMMVAQVDVMATIDTTGILIGQQTVIRLEVVQPQDVVLNFPYFQVGDTLTQNVEILAISKADTSKAKDNRITIRQDYLITSFDSGGYIIPPFKFLAPEQIYMTNLLELNVNNVEVAENAEIKDIKDIYEPPFDWKFFFIVLAIILFASAIIGLGVYFLILKIRKKPIPFFDKEEIKLPPHELAIQKLTTIKEEKIWQKGLDKLYYTQLTDTLREYFVPRFNIPAMEMTSAEIITALQNEEHANTILSKLKQIFAVSDLVKFAKGQPTIEENEMSLVNAFFVVVQTTPQEPVVEEGEKNEDGMKNDGV